MLYFYPLSPSLLTMVSDPYFHTGNEKLGDGCEVKGEGTGEVLHDWNLCELALGAGQKMEGNSPMECFWDSEVPLPQQRIPEGLLPAVFCQQWGILWLALSVTTFLGSDIWWCKSSTLLFLQRVLKLVSYCCETNYYKHNGLKQHKFIILVFGGSKSRYSITGSRAQGLTRLKSRCWPEKWSQMSVRFSSVFCSHMVVGKIYFGTFQASRWVFL